MYEQDEEKMTPLDQMIAEDQLQMLKAAIPYSNPRFQPILSVFAKCLELERTISLFTQPTELSMMSENTHSTSNPIDMLNDIARFATGERKESLEAFIQTFETLQLVHTCGEVQNDTE
ncbi:MAG: hypothetical protein SOT28_11410 [Fusicatenibacter sp.]|nr:hypothetical protein [Lachnospiraceae bacterium]MDY2938894.1 hypothetical protein [Fusicatenibacter sp.]